MIWNNRHAYQKFQKYITGQIKKHAYLDFIQRRPPCPEKMAETIRTFKRSGCIHRIHPLPGNTPLRQTCTEKPGHL